MKKVLCIFLVTILSFHFVVKSLEKAEVVSQESELKDVPDVAKKPIIETKEVSEKLQKLLDKISRNPALLAAGIRSVKNFIRELNEKLHEAVANKDLKTVKKLVAIGPPYVDINWQDSTGFIPLHRAAMFDIADVNAFEIVKILMRGGSDINKKDPIGMTPLHYATVTGVKKTIEYLIKNGANIDAQDNKGNTSLHYICFVGSPEFAKFFIEKGADTAIKNKDGKTPYDFIVEGGFEKEFEVLKDFFGRRRKNE